MEVPIRESRRAKTTGSSAPLSAGVSRAQDRLRAARTNLTMRASRIRIAWRIMLLALFFSLAAIVWLNQTSDIVSKSYQISDFERQKVKLDREAAQLQSQLAQYDDLRKIDEIARTKLGMVPASKVVYLKVPALASGPEQPAAGSATEVPVTEWWKDLVQMLPRQNKETKPANPTPANR